MKYFWLSVIALLTGPVESDQKGAPARDSIGWGVTGAWGASWRNVEVDDVGNVSIAFRVDLPPDSPCIPDPPLPGREVTHCPEPQPARSVVRRVRYSIGNRSYLELRAILAPLEPRAARRARCHIYDAGRAWVSWRTAGRESSYGLGDACSAREVRWADQLADAAERRLTEMGKTAPDYRTEDSTQ